MIGGFEFDFGAQAWRLGVEVAFEVERVWVLTDAVRKPAEAGWFVDAGGVAGELLFPLEVGFAECGPDAEGEDFPVPRMGISRMARMKWPSSMTQ